MSELSEVAGNFPFHYLSIHFPKTIAMTRLFFFPFVTPHDSNERFSSSVLPTRHGAQQGNTLMERISKLTSVRDTQKI